MAAFFKFEQFSEDLVKKVHDLHNDTLKVYLSNAAPSASGDAIKTDLAEISAGNGYTAGGIDTQNAVSETGGTATVTAVDAAWTASGGAIGPFQYVGLYNDTPTSPVDPLIGCWNYGSALTLNDGESLSVDFQGNSLLAVA